MYCPNCGKANPDGRKFCRSCGISLEAIAPALTGESSIGLSEERSYESLSRLQAAWHNPFVYALLLIVLGVLLGAIGERPLRSQTAHDIGTIIALLGVGLLGLKGVMMVVAPPRLLPPVRRSMPVEQTSALRPNLLSAEPPSVTENTTRQLDANVDVGKQKSRDTQPTQ